MRVSRLDMRLKHLSAWAAISCGPAGLVLIRITSTPQAAAFMRAEKEAMAQCLINEVAKPAKDAMAEVVRGILPL